MTLTIGYVLWRDIVSAYRFNLAFAAEYRQMERQLAMQVEYADQLAQRSDENRRLIHDFRQHLRTITELAGQIESRPETEEHRRELLRYLEDFPSVLARRPGVSPAVSATGRRWTPCCNIIAPPPSGRRSGRTWL